MESKSVSKITGLGPVKRATLESKGIRTIGDLAKARADDLGIPNAQKFVDAAVAMLPAVDPEEEKEDTLVRYLISTHSWQHRIVCFYLDGAWIDKAFVTSFSIDPSHSVGFVVGWIENGVECCVKVSPSFLLHFNNDLPEFTIMINAEDAKIIPSMDAVKDAVSEIKAIQHVARNETI